MKYLVIHCSDSPNTMNIGAAEIHQWHLSNGWSGIGYHYIIKRDGTLELGRPEYWSGSHVKGYNKNSIGICLVGRDEFTNKQYSTLLNLLRNNLCVKYPDAKVLGHNELSDYKTCPNFDVQAFLRENLL